MASARGVQQRWKDTYQGTGKPMSETWSKIYDQLVELGENPALDKVAEIIGNKLWSHITCDGCSDYVERAVAIGDDQESRAYCETCIQEASIVLADKRCVTAPCPSQTDASEPRP